MKIIIVGFGKVGYALAEQLNNEGHDLTVIDINEGRMQQAVSQLDIQAIKGSGTSYLLLLRQALKRRTFLLRQQARMK